MIWIRNTASGGVVTVLSLNYHPSGGVVSVLSWNYHPSGGLRLSGETEYAAVNFTHITK